jgi:multidrug efflux pump subunit AcrB
MKRLVAFFVDRSLLVNVISLFVCGAGIVVATMTNRALLPHQKPRAVKVTAELPGASAVDVERFVTFRLEEALQGIEEVERVTSTTRNGGSEITVRSKPEVEDITLVLEKVRSRLSSVRHLLPKDLRPLRIEQEGKRGSDGLMGIFIENIDEKNPAHRRAVEDLADKLRRIPNILEVQSSMKKLHLVVRFSQAKMDRLGLDVQIARQRILEFFQNKPVGNVHNKDQEIAVELDRPLGDPLAVSRIPLLANRVGRSVRLGEVATVAYEFPHTAVRETLNGKPYVAFNIIDSIESDAIEISRAVQKIIKDEAPKVLPEPVTARVGYDASGLIEHEINTLQANGLGGIAVVLMMLVLFLGFRVSLMTAIGLPFCYLGIVVVMYAFGINFNITSLVAMILVVGLLVDDAIIVSEEFCQQQASAGSPRDAAVGAVMRVGKPVIGMVATTCVAFAPLLFMKSDDSWILRPIPIVIMAALLLSLFESMFLLPNHLSHFMGRRKLPRRRFLAAIQRGYGRLLHVVLKLRYAMLVLLAVLVAAAIWLIMGPVKFTSQFNLSVASMLFIELKEPASSLDELNRVIQPVEKEVKDLPRELKRDYTVKIGRSWTPSWKRLQGWKYATINIYPEGTITEQNERRFQIATRLMPRLRELQELSQFERLRFREDRGADMRDVVTIYVSGSDRVEFTEVQDAIRSSLKKVDNVKDIYMDESRFQRSFRFVTDDRKVLSYGISKTDLYRQLREHFSARELIRIRHRGEEIEVFLGFGQRTDIDRAKLAKISVVGQRGVAVPLRYLGQWEEVQVLREIDHRDRMRLFQVDVLYEKEKVTAEQVAGVIEAQLTPVRKRFPNYYISAKPNEAAMKAKTWTKHIAILCVALVYLCLVLTLNSIIQPIIVIFAIVFGFIGVVLAFYFHGLPLSIMAVIGMLGLAGVVVNDSLVMATTINQLQVQNPADGARAAILSGATTRFRAVVLTSMTTLGGIFPLAYGLAGKAGWITPMVLAVGWGLLFATVLTLLVMPCLLLVIDDVRRLARWVLSLVSWKKRRPRDGSQAPPSRCSSDSA